VNYWYRGPFQNIRSSYINLENFPKESDIENGFRDKIQSKEHMQKSSLYMVELHGKIRRSFLWWNYFTGKGLSTVLNHKYRDLNPVTRSWKVKYLLALTPSYTPTRKCAEN